MSPTLPSADPRRWLNDLGPGLFPGAGPRSLRDLTTFRVGGEAVLHLRAETSELLAHAVRTARAHGIPHFVLGLGANVLVADEGFPGLVIQSAAEEVRWLDEEQGLVRAGAGARIYPDLVNETVARGFGGLHHYVGIPSTVGGALWQNLHFLGPDRSRTVFIEEVLESAEILTEQGEVRTVDVDYFEFGYDQSILHHRDDVVLSATFRLERIPRRDLADQMRANLRWRDERHPDLWLYPSAGSIFKKIDGIGAGRLIDEVGLKGHTYGDAGISDKHANIIVNLGAARASEVVHLIRLARDRVRKETGYDLETEIDFLGLEV